MCMYMHSYMMCVHVESVKIHSKYGPLDTNLSWPGLFYVGHFSELVSLYEFTNTVMQATVEVIILNMGSLSRHAQEFNRLG